VSRAILNTPSSARNRSLGDALVDERFNASRSIAGPGRSAMCAPLVNRASPRVIYVDSTDRRSLHAQDLALLSALASAGRTSTTRVSTTT